MCIPINLAVEDVLSEYVVRKILLQSDRTYAVGTVYMRQGFGYLKTKINGFNNAARGTPFFVLTDLDNHLCPPALIREWLTVSTKHPNLLFRIAVKEVEAWLLAHRNALATYLGISRDLIPYDVDVIGDPKQFLIRLAQRSPKRTLRESIVPVDNLTVQGPDYNGALAYFVSKHWNAQEAQSNSPSLSSAVRSVNGFTPIYGD